MSVGDNGTSSSNSGAARRVRIHQRLRLVGLGPASFYRDACRLMSGEGQLESTTHLVGHLAREIESALRDVLESLTDRSERVRKSKECHGGKHENEIRCILRALGISETEEVAIAWLKLPGQDNEYGLHARAHRHSLGAPRPLDDKFREFWAEFERILDGVLERFEARYLKVFSVLDELLTKSKPTGEDVGRLKNHVPNNLRTLSYFFEKVDRDAWLNLLKDAGFFKEPPEPVRDEEDRTVAFPPWPESRYLARMAELKSENVQQTVRDIALQVPDTQNTRVHEDLADVALALPPSHAADFVPKAKAWLECETLLLLPAKLAELVSHLVEGNRTEKALDLAAALLAVLPDPKAEEKLTQQGDFRPSLEPRARFDLWTYEQILKKQVPQLAEADGLAALSLLCGLLDDAVRFAVRDPASEAPRDGSYIWRPAIEDHSQNSEIADLRDLLICAVRDGALQLAESDSADVRKIVSLLEEGQWHVFKRIALHLLSAVGHTAADIMAVRLTDRTLFKQVGVRHEYNLLLERRFAELTDEDQEQILETIAAGPDRETFMAAPLVSTGRPPTDQDYERYKKVWQRDRLAPISDIVLEPWNERYRQLVQEVGPPRHPEFPFYMESGFQTPEAPKSREELASLSVADLAAFLRTWKPSDRTEEPSPEGLGAEVRALVAGSPDRYASEAHQFKLPEPTYVRAFVQGLNDAVRQKSPFPWRAVLELCSWCVRQTREIPGRTHDSPYLRYVDPDWGWARAAIADLVGEGFEEAPAEISVDLREAAWDVLQPLTHDDEPTAEYEKRSLDSDMDPATLSINTVRGKAMHAAIRYALWLKRHNKEEPPSFDFMPEVRVVLDERLENDRSLTVRTVYGRWFPWLVRLDPVWAKEAVPKVFPSEPEQRALRDAAWETYIIFCRPDSKVFPMLLDEYHRAVRAIGEARPKGLRPADPDERLAEHLVVLYWQGKLELDEPDGLLSVFYHKAGVPLRTHALHFVGRALWQTEDPVPEQIVDRLRALWESRLGAVRSGTAPAEENVRLSAFGLWFVSGKFGDEWAIEQLEEALTLAGSVELDHLVVEQLAQVAESMPARAVRCLTLMVEGDKKGWLLSGWLEHARTILSAALKSTEKAAQERATELVHRLGARGYLQFRDLLS